MKKSIFIPAILVLLSAIFMQSCGDVLTTPPLINVSVVGTPTYAPGTTVQYQVAVSSSNGDLSTLTVQGTGSVNPASGSGVNYTSPAAAWDGSKNQFVKGTASVTVFYDVKLGSDLANGTKFTLRFQITDAKAQTANQDIDVTVGGGSSGTPMGTPVTGCQIYNYLSALKSGWDMENDVQVSGTVAGKDIWNDTQNQGQGWNGTYGFSPAIWTSSGTDVVPTTSLNYDSATLEQVKAAYDSGSKVQYYFLDMSGTGTTFAVHIRGGNTYAILKITAIVGIQKSTPQDDYIQFDYKKATLAK
jgi:ribosomal protein S6E (S10)